MTQQQEHQAPSSKMGLLRIIGSLPLVVVLLVVLAIYEAFAPASISIIPRLAAKIALFESTIINETLKANTDYENAMQHARAEIEWISKNYEALYQITLQSMETAYSMEKQLFDLQSKSIGDTYGMDKFTANVTSGACSLGKLLNDPMLLAGCEETKRLRTSMAQEQKDILENSRSTIAAKALSDLPKPSDIKLRDHKFGRQR